MINAASIDHVSALNVPNNGDCAGNYETERESNHARQVITISQSDMRGNSIDLQSHDYNPADRMSSVQRDHSVSRSGGETFVRPSGKSTEERVAPVVRPLLVLDGPTESSINCTVGQTAREVHVKLENVSEEDIDHSAENEFINVDSTLGRSNLGDPFPSWFWGDPFVKFPRHGRRLMMITRHGFHFGLHELPARVHVLPQSSCPGGIPSLQSLSFGHSVSSVFNLTTDHVAMWCEESRHSSHDQRFYSRPSNFPASVPSWFGSGFRERSCVCV